MHALEKFHRGVHALAHRKPCLLIVFACLKFRHARPPGICSDGNIQPLHAVCSGACLKSRVMAGCGSMAAGKSNPLLLGSLRNLLRIYVLTACLSVCTILGKEWLAMTDNRLTSEQTYLSPLSRGVAHDNAWPNHNAGDAYDAWAADNGYDLSANVLKRDQTTPPRYYEKYDNRVTLPPWSWLTGRPSRGLTAKNQLMNLSRALSLSTIAPTLRKSLLKMF